MNHFLQFGIPLLCSFFPSLHLISAIMALFEKGKKIQKHTRKNGMSVLIPCYEEAPILETTISGMLSLDYPDYEVIFINDGSTDNTFETLQLLLDLVPSNKKAKNRLLYQNVKGVYVSQKYPFIYVIDKVNGGKADALNSGIDYASKKYVVTLDADSVLQHDALLYMNEYIENNEGAIALGGTVMILQGLEKNGNYNFQKMNWLSKFQSLEYFTGFFVLKDSLARRKALIVISGAFGVFDTEIIINIGGYRKTLGEDIDITLKFQQFIKKHPQYKMLYAKEAVCYTECPENIRDLHKQRVRWQKAFMDCFFKYQFWMWKRILSPLGIFFLIDSFFTGAIGTFYVAFEFIKLGFHTAPYMSIFAESYLLGCCVINFLWSLVAFLASLRIGIKYEKKNYVWYALLMILDMSFFRICRIYLWVAGSLAYFITGRHSWNKVSRTGKNYNIAG